MTPERARARFEAAVPRYEKSLRRRLRILGAASPRLADLALSFPAAAAALAGEARAPKHLGAGVALVKAGAPLPEIGAALGLASWTRKLPPEAFRRPPPVIAPDDYFDRRIPNFVPGSRDEIGMWLEWTTAARAATNDPAFALWIARQKTLWSATGPGPEAIAPLAAYFWFSKWVATGPKEDAALRKAHRAHEALTTPFSVHARFAPMVRGAAEWLFGLANGECRKSAPGKGWATPQAVGGFKFAPREIGDLEAEGELMQNCVGTYGSRIARGESLIYAVRRGGRTVATMEIVASPNRPGEGRIAQLEAPMNRPAPTKVWDAAHAWLRKQGRCPLLRPDDLAASDVDRKKFGAAMAPFAAASPWAAARAPMFAKPTVEGLQALSDALHVLAALARRR